MLYICFNNKSETNMGSSSLYGFLQSTGVCDNYDDTIKRELKIIESEAWMRGYRACLLHAKRRKSMRIKRGDTALKRFIDFLSDLTHSPEKS